MRCLITHAAYLFKKRNVQSIRFYSTLKERYCFTQPQDLIKNVCSVRISGTTIPMIPRFIYYGT